LPLPPGPHLLRARLDLTPPSITAADLEGCRFTLSGVTIPPSDLIAASARGDVVPVEVPIDSAGAATTVELQASCPSGRAIPAALWLSDLEVTRR
jgi:hypothetical protein